MPAVAPVDARHALLGGLIDHAPTFPPAKMPLDEALREHEAALHSEQAWICNRFVVRASQLPDLPPDHPYRLSVVADAELEYDPRIEAIEFLPRPPRTRGWSTMPLDSMPERPKPWAGREPLPDFYDERPLGPDFEEWARLEMPIVRAKIRCGPTAPTNEELAHAIRTLRAARRPFKATAGLHHAVRTDGQHGFLNLLAAATFGDEEDALAETDAEAFAVDADLFRWRDWEARPNEVAAMRRDLFVSFGSCSFTEPVDELRELGLL